MEKFTQVLGTLSVILFVLLLITVLPTENEGAIYDDTLRLHILANSDTAEDQSLKLAVRDRLLCKYGTALSDAGSKSAAADELKALIPEIESDVCTWIGECGYDYGCRIEIGEEWYERREYDGFALPEGYYTSLVVNIGKADGQNWWCVMYPPLCLDMATEGAEADDALLGYNKEEAVLVTGGRYTLKFKLLEITSEFFSQFKKKG